MHSRSLTRCHVSLALATAVLAFSPMASAVVAVPLEGHRWQFDEGSGSIAYDEIGTLDGTVGSSTAWTVGPLGTSAIYMAPSGIYDMNANVDFGYEAGAFGTGDFTVTHWLSTTFNTADAHGDIIGNRVAGSYGNFFSVRLRGDGSISVELCQNGSGVNYVALDTSPAFHVNDGQWHHLAYVRAGAKVGVYIDGVLAGVAVTPSGEAANITGLNPLRIGRRLPAWYTNFHSIPAGYDDVRIFDRVLSEDEVLDVLNGAL